MEIYISQFVLLVLMFVRVTSAIVTVPLLGHQSIPVQIKVGLGMFIAYIMFPMVMHQSPAIDFKLGGLVLIALKEVLVGVLMGFILGLFFAGIRYAGELMTFSMGLSVANIFDPESAQNTPVIGEFLYLSTILIFLTLNGHHFIFESLSMTFKMIPVGTAEFREPLAQLLIRSSGLMFVVAMKVASPVLVAGFLTNIGLAILSRVMPQANIFMLGFPITIGVGLLVLLSSVPFLVLLFKKLLAGFEYDLVELMKALQS